MPKPKKIWPISRRKCPPWPLLRSAGSKGEEPAETRPVGDSRSKVRISPAARKMAKDAGIDINTLVGSHPGARIVKEDVLKAIEASKAAPPAKVAERENEQDGEMIDGKRVRATLPLTGIRGVVAEHMVSSLRTSAQLSVMGEVDVTGLVRFRQSCLEQEAALHIRISYTDILVCILAKILREQPIMNASLIDDSVKLWDDVNIGVAVALPEEEYDSQLVVPVVHHADRMTLSEISRAISDVVKRARENRLTMDDISCGTFTLSNLGTLSQGYSFTTPIINQPQVAILGTGPIVKRPLVEDDQIVIRPVMNYNLTFDHRVINGAPAAKFINRMINCCRIRVSWFYRKTVARVIRYAMLRQIGEYLVSRYPIQILWQQNPDSVSHFVTRSFLLPHLIPMAAPALLCWYGQVAE